MIKASASGMSNFSEHVQIKSLFRVSMFQLAFFFLFVLEFRDI
jgi:hypothetical protein